MKRMKKFLALLVALVLSQCDTDGSGEVDYVDAMMILQYHTGVISGF